MHQNSYKRSFVQHKPTLWTRKKFQVNNLTLHLKELEKEEETKYEVIIISETTGYLKR